MQAQGKGANGTPSGGNISGLRGLISLAPEQRRKPSKNERAAARNELDKYDEMDWDDRMDSKPELHDSQKPIWTSASSNDT